MKHIALLILSFALWPGFCLSSVPQLMSYHGFLMEDSGQPVSDGIYQITFRIYTQESGGSAEWEETQDISVESGVLNALLGSVNSIADFPLSDNAWLGIQIEGQSEMSPRKRIASVGYSFNAGESDNSQSLQGFNASDFMLNSDYEEPLIAYGSVESVSVNPGEWTTLIQIDVVLPVEMILYSFGTVSGAGWVDGWRMLQISLYNENWSQFFPYSNPFGDIAASYHILPAGLYHLQLYGANMTGDVATMTDIGLYTIGFPHNDDNQRVNVVPGPFPPPPNAELPDPQLLKRN